MNVFLLQLYNKKKIVLYFRSIQLVVSKCIFVMYIFRFITHLTKMEIPKEVKEEYHLLIRTRIDECVPFVNFFLIRKKRSYVHVLDKMPKGRNYFFFNVHCHYTVFYLSLLHKNPTLSVISKNDNTSLKSLDKVKSPHRENML